MEFSHSEEVLSPPFFPSFSACILLSQNNLLAFTYRVIQNWVMVVGFKPLNRPQYPPHFCNRFPRTPYTYKCRTGGFNSIILPSIISDASYYFYYLFIFAKQRTKQPSESVVTRLKNDLSKSIPMFSNGWQRKTGNGREMEGGGGVGKQQVYRELNLKGNDNSILGLLFFPIFRNLWLPVDRQSYQAQVSCNAPVWTFLYIFFI